MFTPKFLNALTPIVMSLSLAMVVQTFVVCSTVCYIAECATQCVMYVSTSGL